MEPKPGQWSQQDPHMCPDAWREYVSTTCRTIDTRMRLAATKKMATQLRETLFGARSLAAVWRPSIEAENMLDEVYMLACDLWRTAQAEAIAAQIELEAMQNADVLDEEPPCAN